MCFNLAAEIEANKKEVARLRELQLSQQKARLQANANESSRLMNWEQARLMEQMANSGLNQSGRQMEPSNSRKGKNKKIKNYINLYEVAS